MNSLRSSAPIIVLSLLLSLSLAARASERANDSNSSKLPIAPAIEPPPKSDETGDAASEPEEAKDSSKAKQTTQPEGGKGGGLKSLLKRKKKDDAEAPADTKGEGAGSEDPKAKEAPKDAGPIFPAQKLDKEAMEKRTLQQALMKTLTTPFSSASASNSGSDANNGAISLSGSGAGLRSRTLGQRLVTNRVFLPGKMIIGRTAEFVVKGRPGSNVAIAMADKDSGAKSIAGHTLRLGADRKVVGVGVIPETGILTVYVDMPIQGDLIGLPVFFETAIWQKPDFSDLEIASPVKSESAEEIADKPNGILVSEEKEQKRGIRFVPDSGVPLHQRGNVSLESGRP